MALVFQKHKGSDGGKVCRLQRSESIYWIYPDRRKPLMQMMQFAFFASTTLKNDSEFNPDCPKNQARPAPLNPSRIGSPPAWSIFKPPPPRPPNLSLRSQTQLSWRLLRRLAFVISSNNRSNRTNNINSNNTINKKNKITKAKTTCNNNYATRGNNKHWPAAKKTSNFKQSPHNIMHKTAKL